MATAATGPVLLPVGNAEPAPGRPGRSRGRDGAGAFAGALAEALGRTGAPAGDSQQPGAPGQRGGPGVPAEEAPAEAGDPALVAEAWAATAAGGVALVPTAAVAGEAGEAGAGAAIGLSGAPGGAPVAHGAAVGAAAGEVAGAALAGASDGVLTLEGKALPPPGGTGAGRPPAAEPGSAEPFPGARSAEAGNGPGSAEDHPAAGGEGLPGVTATDGDPKAAAAGERMPVPVALADLAGDAGPIGGVGKTSPLFQAPAPAAEAEGTEGLSGSDPAAAGAGQAESRPGAAAGPEEAARPGARESRAGGNPGPEALSGEGSVPEAQAPGVAPEPAGVGDQARAGEVSEPRAQAGRLNSEPGLAEQVARAMERARLRVRPDGETQVRIRLEPPELGAIHLRLTLRDGQIHGQILAGRPEVRDALEAQKAELWSRLQEQGIQVGGFDVGLAGDWGAPRHGEARPGRRSGHRGALAGGEGFLPGLAPAAAGEEAVHWPGGRGSRRIDFRA
nr:MAG: hypothetical protein DIU70_05830 [Bacillota bacterium]